MTGIYDLDFRAWASDQAAPFERRFVWGALTVGTPVEQRRLARKFV
jgi:hypothetical protein